PPGVGVCWARHVVPSNGEPIPAAPAPVCWMRPLRRRTQPSSERSRPAISVGAAEDQAAAGGVVGGGVLQAESPVGDAAVDDLDGGQAAAAWVAGGARH